MSDTGNAVAAKWVGPDGHQLFDGSRLAAGDVVLGIGKDEAEASPYWESLGDLDAYTGDTGRDVSHNRLDVSFGAEEGGGSTGRPLTEAQQKKASRSLPKPKGKDSGDGE